MSAWTQLPNGRWQLRVSDDHWYQADPSGAVILSPMGIRQTTVPGGIDAVKRETFRRYRASLEAQEKRGYDLARAARAGLAILNREDANSQPEPEA